ncbi:hypothetical protein AN619_23470 [Thermotalea metallivorans]|uniref:Uncharacterized protein n=2 Tax=Thermotalea metallivorans TaxID=520762 RepID=A0A140L1M4_9FIRM|nr:hypothetical protein AN619_23470 [Thermotalea metallivorans]
MVSFKRKVGNFRGRRLFKDLIKVALSCLVMAVVVIISLQLFDTYFTEGSFRNKILRVVIPSLTGMIAYGAAAFGLKIEEAQYIYNDFLKPIANKIRG